MIRMIRGLGFLLLIVAATACTNLFENFANTASDQALLDAAQIYNDNRDFDSALAQFAQMSSSYQTRRDVVALWASSYAGRAGLDFVTLAEAVKNIGSTNLFLFLMQNFENGSASKLSDLLAAQTKMASIATSVASYTNGELMEFVVISLANMGTILSTYDDTNNDGTADGNVCTTAFPAYNGGAAIPAGNVGQFGVSLNYVMAAITQLSANGVSFGPATVTGATAACAALVSAGAPFSTYAFCNVYDPTAITNNQYKGILSLINEGTAGIGLGTCAGDIIACACP